MVSRWVGKSSYITLQLDGDGKLFVSVVQVFRRNYLITWIMGAYV
jgi:hypothetical protein